MKKILALVLVLAMALSLVACGGSSNPETPAAPEAGNAGSENAAPATTQDTLIIRGSGDPMSFNPSAAADDNYYYAAQNMFHRLAKLDANKSPVPDAAESWDVSEDALTITWHLKKNLTWTDGEALNAEDVKYTFDYIKENASCYFSSSMAIVDSIEIVDDYTVVFHMNTADVSFVARAAWYATFILPEHIFNNGQKWEDNPASTDPSKIVSSGPYKMESYTQGSNMTLVARDDYAEVTPAIKKLIFAIIPDDATAIQALLNGELDYLQNVPAAYTEQLLNDPNYRMVQDIYPSPYRFIFNMQNEVIADLAVRKAITLCVDRNEISQKVYQGIMPPEWSAYPAIVDWAANTTDIYPDQNLEEAMKVLEAAGYTKDADGYYIRGITWDVFEGLEDMVNLIIDDCKSAGIEITMILSEYNAWAEKVGPGGDYMIEAQGGFMGPDPAALASRYGTGSGSNYGSWSNAEFDRLCAEAAATGDQAKRAELYRAAQKIMIEELPAVNVVGYASYTVMPAGAKNMPEDGAGKWGWADYCYAYFE